MPSGPARVVGFLENVFAVFEELARRDVQRQCHLRPYFIARLSDRLEEQLNGSGITCHPRRKAALVADAGGKRTVMEYFFKRLKNLRRRPQRFFIISFRAERHEFLNSTLLSACAASTVNIDGNVLACAPPIPVE